MRTNFEAIELIKTFESLRLRAYRCPAGIYTIGYGRTKGITEGMNISPKEALEFLHQDIREFELQVEAILLTKGILHNRRGKGIALNDNQFSACVSLAYNIGIEAFRTSTLVKYLSQAHFDQAADQFLLWNKSKGKILAGLTKRRIAERELFLKPIKIL